MLTDLTDFIARIENFENLPAAEMMDFFVYYFTIVKKEQYANDTHITDAYSHLRLVAYTRIKQYLKQNSNAGVPKKSKIKFLYHHSGYHLEATYEKELKLRIKDTEVPFINFQVNSEHLYWKPSDIPFLNSKNRKSAEFFAKLYFLLYHLENSLRNFLKSRLLSILGQDWETKVIQSVDLTKALAIRHEASLSEMLPDRGENILFYCMWEDYGKIIRTYPNIFTKTNEADEVLAHLSSLTKIRNAIAHNTATIPQEYQEEMTLFLKKYIKMMKHYQA